MAGFTAPGNIVWLVAPSGGVTKGILALVGALVVVPITSAAETVGFTAYVTGVHPAVKASGTTALAGAAAYWNSTTGLIETADSPTNRRIGVFAEAAVSGSTSCEVRLDGRSFGGGDDDLEAKADSADLASTDAGLGASLIGVEDAAGDYLGDTVEECLAEVKVIADAAAVAVDLASVATGEGASLIGVEDAGGFFDDADVEAILAFIGQFMGTKLAQTKQVVIALGAATGSAVADPAWINAKIIGFRPVSGNDQAVKAISVDGAGVVTVEVAGNETAEATFEVLGNLA